ncbi:biotin--[acetyl-CoA-carboxylase] ligase [Acidianus brierleyi]|uniref:Biotin--[acetyl-CoA-carboxylase] ligase n=1 Tax=Acidianus brierleyi TaxID=41673 RepID=A0A2U9IFB1_9CREN|nr:biotin--[acetyl-CoA-carboxylase] ligase [Acidianus brierleyi]AWR94732.1 biotin--[acetyl-CoA-carboxylase] ligase [Acidianus brierleyi]
MLIKLNKVTSTQDFAEAVYSMLYSDFVVIAGEQTKARGRYRREWYSPQGGLWFTYCKRGFPIEEIPIATLKVALAIRYVLEEYVDAKIRWPNDIVVNGKKISGILIEGILQGNDSTMFIGAGINTNIKNFPSELNATSVLIEKGKELDNDELLKNIINSIEIYLNKDDESTIEEINTFLYIKNKKVNLYGNDWNKTCTAMFVDRLGRLITDCGIFEVEDVLRLETS